MRAYKSDDVFAITMSKPERVMRKPTNALFLTTFCQQGEMTQKEIDVLDDFLRSQEEGTFSIPEHNTNNELKYLSKFLNHPQLQPTSEGDRVEESEECVGARKG